MHFTGGTIESLRERNQKFPFGGTIAYGVPCLAFPLYYSKIIRQHTSLIDAAGLVRSRTVKRPGCSFKIGRRKNIRSLGHVTNLVYFPQYYCGTVWKYQRVHMFKSDSLRRRRTTRSFNELFQ